MPNQIQVELDGKAVNLTVSDGQMSIVSDDGREFKAVELGDSHCSDCAFDDLNCSKIPCCPRLRDAKDDVYFIELT
ncbi:MAG: hypothetical protein ACRCVE_01895 [Plesiomonas sp.]